MRYLITSKDNEPFLTEYYQFENHFNPDIGMVVFDLAKSSYSTNGQDWMDIEEDHL